MEKGNGMIAVIFEVEPAKGRKDDCLGIAASLRSELESVDGFNSVERFQSLTNQEKLLTLSFFRDEKSASAWRNLSTHRKAQKAGRRDIFSGYWLRNAEVSCDYGRTDRVEAPAARAVCMAFEARCQPILSVR